MPPLPVPKSIATPSLLAQVATSKYVDGLPLYRQEKIFERLGLDLSRATLAHWMVRMGDLVEPLMDRIREEIRSYDFVQCDETPFQVLKEPGKTAQSQSYLWALRGGEPEHPLIYYEYDPSRSGEVPKRLLRRSKAISRPTATKVMRPSDASPALLTSAVGRMREGSSTRRYAGRSRRARRARRRR